MDDIIKRSLKIFATSPPFDLSLGKSHVEYAQAFSLAQRRLTPNIVYVYRNKELIEGSPFSTYSAAHKALGLNSSSKTCIRYIDTGKLYKKEYLFRSQPLDD